MPFTNTKIIGKSVDPVEYHKQNARRGSAEFKVSPSSLREFGRCPARWLAGYEPPGSGAKETGNLFDCLALTPDQFANRYAVHPSEYPATPKRKGDVKVMKPWNSNADYCRAWNERQGDREILSEAEVFEAQAAIAKLNADPTIRDFFEASDRQVLVEGEWQDEDSGLTVPVRCLIDLVPRVDTEFAKSMGDLKTTRHAALMPWQRDCFTFGYHVQAAFDIDLYVAATGEDRTDWCFILQESFAPWQTGKRLLSTAFLELGRAEYRRLLGNYAHCLKSGFWPGYDDTDESTQGWSIVEPEPFMAERAAFAPRYDFQEAPVEELEAVTDWEITP